MSKATLVQSCVCSFCNVAFSLELPEGAHVNLGLGSFICPDCLGALKSLVLESKSLPPKGECGSGSCSCLA